MRAHSLAKRAIDDEALEFGDDLRVSAELELSLDLLLDHRESELFEPYSLRESSSSCQRVREPDQGAGDGAPS